MKLPAILILAGLFLPSVLLCAQDAADAGAAPAQSTPAPATIPPPPGATQPGAIPPPPAVSIPARTNRAAVPRQFPRPATGAALPGATNPPGTAARPTSAAPAVAATTNAAAPAAAVSAPAVTAAAATNRPAGAPLAGQAQPPAITSPAANAAAAAAAAAANPPPAIPGVNPATNPDPNASTNIVILPGGAVKLVNMPLDQFLQAVYARKVGKTILRPQNLPQIQINFEQTSALTDAELLQAYDSVLALNGVTTIPTGDKFITVVPSTQAQTEGAAFTSKGKGDLPEASQYVTTIIQLKHVKPGEIVNALSPFAKNPNNIVALESTSTLILRDYSINVKRMLEVIEKIDVVVEDDYTLEVIPIKYGRVEDIFQTLSGVIGGTSGGGGAAGANFGGAGQQGGFGRGGSGGFGRGGSSGFGRGGGFGGGFGGSSFGGGFGGGSSFGRGGFGGSFGNGFGTFSNGIEPIPGDVTPQAGDIRPMQTTVNQQPSFQNRLTGANRAAGAGAGQKPEHSLVDDARIIPDQRSNSLIIFASKKDMEQIRKVVDKVDTLLAQVLIEGIVMNVSLADDWNYGISAGQRPKRFDSKVAGGGTVNNSLGGSNPLNGGIGFLTGALGAAATNGAVATYPGASGFGYSALLGSKWDIALSAAASDSRIDLVQRPRIITSHSVPASFFVGSQLPFKQGGFSYGGGGESSYYSTLPVGIGINVTPFITPDNLVVMEISQNIDAVAGKFDPASGIPPTTTTREASAVVTVRSGDVILLGGFLDNNKSIGSSGVPLLKDIPLLGNLFKSKSSSQAKSELMILVRPTILPKPTDVATYTDQQRRDSGNIQKLEQSFNEDDYRSRMEAEMEREKAEKRQRARDEKKSKSRK